MHRLSDEGWAEREVWEGGESFYKSPTDMGVNRAGFGIVDDAVDGKSPGPCVHLTAAVLAGLREGALALGAGFMIYAIKIYRNYSDLLARKTFRFSITYLTALFAALLIDHYLRILL